VAHVWLSRSSASLPTYAGLVLPHERFSAVVPFDDDCKHSFWVSDLVKLVKLPHAFLDVFRCLRRKCGEGHVTALAAQPFLTDFDIEH
jgi:hypothetical protein